MAKVKTKDEKTFPPGVEPEGDVLTAEQVAAWLQVDKSTVYKKKQQLGARKVLGAIRIPKENVLKMFEREALDEHEG